MKTVVTTDPPLNIRKRRPLSGQANLHVSQSSLRKTATTNSWSLEECSRNHETKPERKRRGHATEGRTIKKKYRHNLEKPKDPTATNESLAPELERKHNVKTHHPNLPPKPKAQHPTPSSSKGQKK